MQLFDISIDTLKIKNIDINKTKSIYRISIYIYIYISVFIRSIFDFQRFFDINNILFLMIFRFEGHSILNYFSI